MDVPYNGDPARVEPMPGATAALRSVRSHGIPVGVISNQSGIGRGMITRSQVEAVNTRVAELLGPFDVWQLCPHVEGDSCRCRKPRPGMLLTAAEQLSVDPATMVFIGDIGAAQRVATDLGRVGRPVMRKVLVALLDSAGDVLVVAVNDDDSVRRIKGPGRPINPLGDRAGVLAALNCVDYVTAFATDTPIPLISQLQPDVYVKGGDYTPEMLAETAAVEAYGGQVRIMDYVSDHSTTELVKRMHRTEPKEEEHART